MPTIESPPYAFTLIAPYGKMSATAVKVAAGLNCKLSVWEGVTLDEAAYVAREAVAQDRPEVILSRGGTADYVRSAVDIPVVDISTTALDLLRTLRPFADKVARVAFFHYQKPMPEVQSVAAALGMAIDEYLFLAKADMAALMIEAKAKGAELGIGGILVAQMREICGLDGILLEVGEEAVSRALREACSIAAIQRVERQRQARLHTILQTITEGILVTDEKNHLTLINPMAERILGVSAKNVLGKDARDVVPNTRTAEVLVSGIPELNHIQDAEDFIIVTNRAPIIVSGRSTGVVCTFSEADRIHQADQRLRGRLQAKGFTAKYQLSDIASTEPEMHRLKSLAAAYAATDATIILQGESGTGKELFAQGIHRASTRSHRPFVAVNCAAIPESLLESELFGYEEGAFTGARRQGKAGFFELAHEGTLFLDEISELTQAVQARLLRVLQEKEVVRVGGAEVVPVDVRIICATNRNLETWTNEGHFRQDLYYRLNVLSLTLPPLRERKKDIVHLAALFLDRRFAATSVPDEDILDRQIGAALRSHTWPGNVRELRNVMERLALAATMFPEKPWKALLSQIWTPSSPVPGPRHADRGTEGRPCPTSGAQTLKDMTRQFEKNAIHSLLADNDGDQTKVAMLLGISRMSLWRKLQSKTEQGKTKQ